MLLRQPQGFSSYVGLYPEKHHDLYKYGTLSSNPSPEALPIIKVQHGSGSKKGAFT